MTTGLYKKGMVLGIIFLFVGAGFGTSISGDADKINNISDSNLLNVNDGLVAHWSFDDSKNNTYDDSGNGHNGTLHGDPQYLASGGPDGSGCFWFDGKGDYIEVIDTTAFEFTNQDVTFCAWVQLYEKVNPPDDDFYYDFIGIGDHDSYPHIMLARSRPQFWNSRFYMEIYSETDSVLCYSVINGENYEYGKWYFLSGVINTNEQSISLYLNGEINGYVRDIDYDLSKSEDLNLFIGRNCNEQGFKAFHCGLIDDVRIYNRVLNNEEMRQLFHEKYRTTLEIEQLTGGFGKLSVRIENTGEEEIDAINVKYTIEVHWKLLHWTNKTTTNVIPILEREKTISTDDFLFGMGAMHGHIEIMADNVQGAILKKFEGRIFGPFVNVKYIDP